MERMTLIWILIAGVFGWIFYMVSSQTNTESDNSVTLTDPDTSSSGATTWWGEIVDTVQGEETTTWFGGLVDSVQEAFRS